MGVRELDMLESMVFGRARLLPSRVDPGNRLSGSFALPLPGHAQSIGQISSQSNEPNSDTVRSKLCSNRTLAVRSNAPPGG